MNEAIKFINEKFEEFEGDSREKEREIAELKSTINSLNVRLDKVEELQIVKSNTPEETVY